MLLQARNAATGTVGGRRLGAVRVPALRGGVGGLRRRDLTADGGDSGAPAAPAAPAAPVETVRLTLRKPVGLVFEQKSEGGPVFVAEVVEGGAAARTGKVAPGDILSKCSAVVLKAGKEGQYEAEGYGQRPYDN
ncbi:hypothetical protein PLESTB_001739500 [Pleodorina starrii]|uniref:PDZ domain-containing protein n=1 Tax=Pleodorina starrii TaxID=330485 RepID=A0A9W6BZR2_9CHLO|nr:hypothetical protein PLESTM_000747600 [Pleodorina starrii]GLC61284.1 hypothetical protein PLESTB_001739500 [Pleodorina starrii]GLC74710.1 hypothetical protein PLESTF_001547100 [Pleodorina starrii]